MARPQRNSVDYFPFLCKEGKAMFYIENKYGNDGYAVWVKLLRLLAVTEYHYLNLSSKPDLMFTSSKCRVSEEILTSIIDDLCELGEFNKELWYENRVIWSDKFISSIADAYSKRNNKPLDLKGLLLFLDGLGVRKLSKCNLKGDDKPQSIVEDKKPKEKIADDVSNKIYHIGLDSTDNIKDFYIKNFNISYNDLCLKNGKSNVDEALDDFGEFHNNARWKDSNDLRKHFMSYLLKRPEKKEKVAPKRKELDMDKILRRS